MKGCVRVCGREGDGQGGVYVMWCTVLLLFFLHGAMLLRSRARRVWHPRRRPCAPPFPPARMRPVRALRQEHARAAAAGRATCRLSRRAARAKRTDTMGSSCFALRLCSSCAPMRTLSRRIDITGVLDHYTGVVARATMMRVISFAFRQIIP